MTIVNEHIASQGNGGVVVDTACAVSDVSHDQCEGRGKSARP